MDQFQHCRLDALRIGGWSGGETQAHAELRKAIEGPSREDTIDWVHGNPFFKK